MSFQKSDFIVLRRNKREVWGFIALTTRQRVEKYLARNLKAVLVRFNVRMVGNNTPCDTYADAERALAEEKKKNPTAGISLMAPSRDLPQEALKLYYDAEKLLI